MNNNLYFLWKEHALFLPFDRIKDNVPKEKTWHAMHARFESQKLPNTTFI